ncbi:MAG: hypothetical protein ACOCQN_00755 [Halanaerobiaceae bacterium]
MEKQWVRILGKIFIILGLIFLIAALGYNLLALYAGAETGSGFEMIALIFLLSGLLMVGFNGVRLKLEELKGNEVINRRETAWQDKEKESETQKTKEVKKKKGDQLEEYKYVSRR